MTLQDIFDQLAYGELSQLFASEADDDGVGVRPEKRKGLFLSVKLGITELHKRFLLREITLELDASEGRQVFVLDPRYAQSNQRSREPVRYILDADEPFEGGVFRIERVYDGAGVEMPLNQVDNPNSARTSSHNTLLLPNDYKHDKVRVVCRADHAPFNEYLVPESPSLVDINIPPTYLWALLLFVASRKHNPIGIVSEFHEGNNYAQKFEAECYALQNQNFELNRVNDVTRFENSGWV